MSEIRCTDIESFLDVIHGLVTRQVRFVAHIETMTISLIGGF